MDGVSARKQGPSEADGSGRGLISRPRHYRRRWTNDIEVGTVWVESKKHQGWWVILIGSSLLVITIIFTWLTIVTVGDGSVFGAALIIAIFSVPILLAVFFIVRFGIESMRNPTQSASFKIETDKEMFAKWVKGELFFSQIEGQLRNIHIPFERRRDIWSDRAYKLGSGITITVYHNDAIIADEEGEWPTILIGVDLANVGVNCVEEGRALQGLLDDLPLFGYNEKATSNLHQSLQ